MTENLSWEALGAAVNVNRRTLLGLRLEAGAPPNRDPEAWRAFMASRAMNKKGGGSGQPGNGGTDLLPGECSYDDAVSAGQISYADAKIREAVVGEQIANEQKRGTLITRDDMKAKVTKITNACVAALESLPEIYAETLENHQRADGRKRAREWVAALREKFAALLRTETPPSDG